MGGFEMGAIDVVGLAPTDLLGAAASGTSCTPVMARADVSMQLRALGALQRAGIDLFVRTRHERGDAALRVSELGRACTFEDVNFDVRSTEVIALGGLVGAGRTDVGIAFSTTGSALAVDGGMSGQRLRRAPATNCGGNRRIHS